MVLCTILMNSQRSKTKFQTTLDQSCIDLCVESDWGLVSFSSSRVGFPCYSQAPMPLWFTGFLQWGSPSDHGLQCFRNPQFTWNCWKGRNKKNFSVQVDEPLEKIKTIPSALSTYKNTPAGPEFRPH